MTTARRRLETPRRPSRRIAAAAAGLVLVAGTVAVLVSGTDEGTDRVAGVPGAGSSTSTSPVGTGTTGATPGATGSTADPSGTADPATDAIGTPTELERFQLRGSDLPAGWRTLDEAQTVTSTVMGACLRKATTPTEPHSLATASYRDGSTGPVLTASVRDFATPATAARAMTAVRSAVLACARGGGTPRLQTFTVTSGADAAVGVTFSITQDGATARGEVIVAREGARSVTLALVGLDAADLEVGRAAVRTVVARLG